MSSSPNSSSSSDAVDPRARFQALGDVPCRVSFILGTGTISVRQCLGLERQMILTLRASAGEDLTVVVNGVTVARGEVAIIGDGTSIRITEIDAVPREEL